MDPILEIARRHGLKVIEDCAHAPLAVHVASDGSRAHVGTLGDVGCFSFFGNKNMTTGEGGMVVTNDDQAAERIRLLRSHGMTTLSYDRYRGHAQDYDVLAVGYNYRSDDIHSAIGLVQLARLEGFHTQRRAVYRWYIEAFRGSSVIVPFASRDLGSPRPTSCPSSWRRTPKDPGAPARRRDPDEPPLPPRRFLLRLIAARVATRREGRLAPAGDVAVRSEAHARAGADHRSAGRLGHRWRKTHETSAYSRPIGKPASRIPRILPSNHCLTREDVILQMYEIALVFRRAFARVGWDAAALEHKRLLEVGCGWGLRLQQVLGFNTRPQNLVGIDLQPTWIERARTTNPAIRWETMSATSLSFTDRSFDASFAVMALSAMIDPEVMRAALGEIVPVSREFVVIVDNFEPSYENRAHGAVYFRGVEPESSRGCRPGTMSPTSSNSVRSGRRAGGRGGWPPPPSAWACRASPTPRRATARASFPPRVPGSPTPGGSFAVICPLCRSAATRSGRRYHSPFVDADYALHICASCDSAFFDTAETPADLERIYDEWTEATVGDYAEGVARLRTGGAGSPRFGIFAEERFARCWTSAAGAATFSCTGEPARSASGSSCRGMRSRWRADAG